MQLKIQSDRRLGMRGCGLSYQSSCGAHGEQEIVADSRHHQNLMARQQGGRTQGSPPAIDSRRSGYCCAGRTHHGRRSLSAPAGCCGNTARRWISTSSPGRGDSWRLRLAWAVKRPGMFVAWSSVSFAAAARKWVSAWLSTKAAGIARADPVAAARRPCRICWLCKSLSSAWPRYTASKSTSQSTTTQHTYLGL